MYRRLEPLSDFEKTVITVINKIETFAMFGSLTVPILTTIAVICFVKIFTKCKSKNIFYALVGLASLIYIMVQTSGANHDFIIGLYAFFVVPTCALISLALISIALILSKKGKTISMRTDKKHALLICLCTISIILGSINVYLNFFQGQYYT